MLPDSPYRSQLIHIRSVSVMNKRVPNLVFSCMLALACSPSLAVQVVSCEQHWVQLAKELGGDRVSVRSLLSANEDPHHISPGLKAVLSIRAADLLICNDIRDEPHLGAAIKASGNPKVQSGGVGYIEAAAYVATSAIKPSGQRFAWRHVHNDPHNILIVAKVFSDRLAQLDPENALEYHTRYLAFSTKWNDAIRRWEKKAIPLHDLAVIELRQSCAYLCRWLGIREVAKLESREFPSRGAATMRRAVAAAIRDRITMVVRGPYHSSAAVEWLQRQEKVPVAVLLMPISETGSRDLYSMFDDAINRMLTAASHG
jgi:zinc/manganese transport system substrate-binding protein